MQSNQLYLVPPVAALLAKHPFVTTCDLSCVEYIACGAAPLGKEVAQELQDRLGPTFKGTRQGKTIMRVPSEQN